MRYHFNPLDKRMYKPDGTAIPLDRPGDLETELNGLHRSLVLAVAALKDCTSGSPESRQKAQTTLKLIETGGQS